MDRLAFVSSQGASAALKVVMRETDVGGARPATRTSLSPAVMTGCSTRLVLGYSHALAGARVTEHGQVMARRHADGLR